MQQRRWKLGSKPSPSGQPAATVPAGWTEDGLPVGLQIIGPHLDDETVLEASAAYEASNPWQEQYFPSP